MVQRSHPLLAALFLSSCSSVDEPRAVDPAPVLGCYVAVDAPALRVRHTGIRIGQNPEVLPFRYEKRKVGMVLAIPMVASVSGGGLEFRPAAEHFYRVLWREGKPVINVAFGPDGIIRDYKRHPESDC